MLNRFFTWVAALFQPQPFAIPAVEHIGDLDVETVVRCRSLLLHGSNAERAADGLYAVQSFAITRGVRNGEPVEHVITDLLTDVLHLCDQIGLDVIYVLDTTMGHFSVERAA